VREFIIHTKNQYVIVGVIEMGKCKYYNKCKLRNPKNPPCVKDRGQYYDFGRYPGCYRKMEKIRHEETGDGED